MQGIKENDLPIQPGLEDGLKLANILFRSAATPILFIDQHSRVLMANTSCSKLLGFEQSELAGMQFSAFLDQEQIHDLNALVQSLRRDEQYFRGEFRLRNSDGSAIVLELTVQRVELSDKIIHALYLDRNKPYHTEENELSPDSSALNDALQSLQREHNRYLSDLAHQIEISLLPNLEKMTREPDLKIRNNYKDVLTQELISLSNGSSMQVDRDLLKLTPTEMEVCKYIQSGLSSKEIAGMMHSSFDTIQTHRKNIRRKMGLKGQKTPLCTYLRVEKRLQGNHIRTREPR